VCTAEIVQKWCRTVCTAEIVHTILQQRKEILKERVRDLADWENHDAMACATGTRQDLNTFPRDHSTSIAVRKMLRKLSDCRICFAVEEKRAAFCGLHTFKYLPQSCRCCCSGFDGIPHAAAYSCSSPELRLQERDQEQHNIDREVHYAGLLWHVPARRRRLGMELLRLVLLGLGLGLVLLVLGLGLRLRLRLGLGLRLRLRLRCQSLLLRFHFVPCACCIRELEHPRPGLRLCGPRKLLPRGVRSSLEALAQHAHRNAGNLRSATCIDDSHTQPANMADHTGEARLARWHAQVCHSHSLMPAVVAAASTASLRLRVVAVCAALGAAGRAADADACGAPADGRGLGPLVLRELAAALAARRAGCVVTGRRAQHGAHCSDAAGSEQPMALPARGTITAMQLSPRKPAIKNGI
jgi:hypothetical protein